MESKDKIIFSDLEKDVIGEVMNISLGSSATTLSSILDKRVDITVPKVNTYSLESFNFDNMGQATGVEIKYISGFEGINLMILKKHDIKKILEILLSKEISDEDFVLDDICESAISEVMNQMMGTAATSLANFSGRSVNISVPVVFDIDNSMKFKSRYFDVSDIIVAVSFKLKVENTIDSEFIYVMPLALAKEIVTLFLSNNGMNSEKDNMDGQNASDSRIDEDSKRPIPAIKVQKRKVQSKPTDEVKKTVTIKTVQHESFDNEEENLTEEQISNLGLIMSVPLQISVEIGKARKKIKDVLEFTQGTIIELDKAADAQVDIVVNGQVIAKGDVVVVNDNFGVRVTEIVQKNDLMKITL